MFHEATPLGENITVYVPRVNPSRGEHYHIFSTGQPLMGRKIWQVFNGTTSLRGYSSDAVFSEQPSLGGNTVMGYSLKQPSNEGNACYDGFLGHPRKRGEHAACTPFQMHPQWGHESLHLQTGHPSLGEYKTDTRSPSSIEPPPHIARNS
jgi:hypothetical protein